MGCGSSKKTPVITNAMRIQISPEQTPIDNVLFTKSTRLFARSASESNAAVGKPGVSVRPPSNQVMSPSSSSLAPSLRRRLSADSRRARRSSACIISVEPRVSADVTQRQVSASSRVTADSGFGEERRAGVSAGSRRQEEEDIMDFITEHISCRTDPDRPVTPDLLIEGASFLPAKRKAVFTPKHSHLPGSVETAQLVTTTNILEKAPLPPIHNRVIKSLTFEDKSVQRKQIEQSFEVIERPPSRGGLAFDILMDVPTEKKRALRPIENPLGKKGGKKRRSAAELTKEGIEAKLAAAEERRNKRERDIINSLVEQREIDEKRVKEQQGRYQESIDNREATLGVRTLTMSNNRDAVIIAKIEQAHTVLQKVENARNNRKSNPPSPAADTSENSS